MIVKDEEHRLARCLASVAGVVDEMVVVDTGSTDGTLDIARAWGAKVARFEFCPIDFAAARNASLERATSPWVLVLDADETLAWESREPLQAALRAGRNAAYILNRRNLAPDGTAGVVEQAVRLFPNHPRTRYRGRVHETVNASLLDGGGRLCRSAIFIDHHLEAEARLRAKSRLYLALLKEELAEAPDDAERLTFLAAEYHKLGLLDDAALTAETIARLEPLDPMAHVRVGLYRLVHLRQVRRAAMAFERALELRSDCSEALSALQCISESDPQRRTGTNRFPSERALAAVGA